MDRLIFFLEERGDRRASGVRKEDGPWRSTTSPRPRSPRIGLMFTELSWDEIHAPGAYVERGAAISIGCPQEAIGPASPLIKKHSLGASRLVRITNNPFVTTLEARMLCAEVNINLNF